MPTHIVGRSPIAVASVPPSTAASCALLGCGYAAMQLLAFSLLPDTISDDESRSGQRQAGAFTGVWTAGETLGARPPARPCTRRCSQLRARGFYAQVQLSFGDVPPTLHFSAHGVSPSTVDALLTALTEAVTAARAHSPATPVDLSAVDLSTVDEHALVRLLTETGLSLATMAPINATLDTLPIPAREHLLKVFLSVLLSPGG